MKYHIDLLPNNRCGIYYNSRLLASVDTQEAGFKILAKLREHRLLRSRSINYKLQVPQVA